MDKLLWKSKWSLLLILAGAFGWHYQTLKVGRSNAEEISRRLVDRDLQSCEVISVSGEREACKQGVLHATDEIRNPVIVDETGKIARAR